MPKLSDLLQSFPRSGRLMWIGAAEERRQPLRPLSEAVVEPGTGIEGEHHATSGRSHRQVTVIQHEHLQAVAGLLDREEPLPPEILRRNLVVSGINVLALRKGRFRIGDVLLEGTGPCAPCSRMEENLGPGGYNAMRGHGGITARVIEGGTIRPGDEVTAVTGCPDPDAD